MIPHTVSGNSDMQHLQKRKFKSGIKLEWVHESQDKQNSTCKVLARNALPWFVHDVILLDLVNNMTSLISLS